jgi:hypothetical protein
MLISSHSAWVNAVLKDGQTIKFVEKESGILRPPGLNPETYQKM